MILRISATMPVDASLEPKNMNIASPAQTIPAESIAKAEALLPPAIKTTYTGTLAAAAAVRDANTAHSEIMTVHAIPPFV